MAELIIGAMAAAGFLLLTRFSRDRGLVVPLWQWGLTLLGFFYAVLVLEIVMEFLREGTPKGAMVMGSMMGFVAVVWAVLLARFVFRPKTVAEDAEVGGGSHV